MLWPTNTCSILRTLNTRRFLQCIYSESREVCKPEKFLFPMLNEKETLSSRENFKVCHPLLCSLFVSLVTMTKLNYVLINNFIINQMCNLSYFIQLLQPYLTHTTSSSVVVLGILCGPTNPCLLPLTSKMSN